MWEGSDNFERVVIVLLGSMVFWMAFWFVGIGLRDNRWQITDSGKEYHSVTVQQCYGGTAPRAASGVCKSFMDQKLIGR